MHDESDATNACPRVGRWIGGCRFEARYDTRSPDDSLRSLLSRASETVPAYAIKMLVNESTYVADICTRCGKVVKREGV